MIKENLYKGGHVGDAPLPTVPVPRNVVSSVVNEGMQAVAANIDQAFHTSVAVEDARKEFEASQTLAAVEQGVKEQVEAGLAAPNGDDSSFFDKTGNVRRAKLQNIGNEVARTLGSLGATITDPEARRRVQGKAGMLTKELLTGLQQTWDKVNWKQTGQAWKDSYDLAVAKEKYGEAEELIGRGVELGLFTPDRGEVMKIGLDQMRERKRLEALKAAGRAGDGRVISHELMQSLKQLPVVQAPEMGGAELVSTSGIQADAEDSALTTKNVGLAALPSDELLAGFNVAQRLADSGAVTLGSGVGRLAVQLPDSPGEATQKVAGVAQAFSGYSLADYRNSIAKVAAGYFSDESMSGMTDAQLEDALVDEVHMDGAADAWFEGDELAYKGWLQTELSRLSVTRGSGAVRAADRLLTGAEGRAGLNELLAQEVTNEEIASLGYGFNAVAAITKSGLRVKNDVLAPGFRQAVLEYERYRERWAKELAASGRDYTPSKEDTPGRRYKDDWQEFGKWYMKQADLYKTRRDALEEGVRDVYRQRAVDAVATLRQSGSFKLGSEVVQLDGKSDWAQEEKVIRYVLRQPLNERELGTARALAATKERLFQDRRKRAATYAQAAAEHKTLLKGKQADISAAKEREEQEKKAREKYEAALKQADDERIAGYGRKVERKVTYGSVAKEKGAAEPAVVVIPRKMYAEAAGALGAGAGGFYAFLPGVPDGVPVMAGDVDAIQVNAPVLNLMDGKKNKLTGQQLQALSNEGLMVPVQFSAFQKF